MKSFNKYVGLLSVLFALAAAAAAPRAEAAILIGGGMTGNLGMALLGGIIAGVSTEGSGPAADILFVIGLDEKKSGDQIDQLSQKIADRYHAPSDDASAVAELVYNDARAAVSSSAPVAIKISSDDVARITSSEFRASPGYANLVRDLE